LSVNTTSVNTGSFFGQKIRDYAMLFKFRLSLTVVFSAAMGFLLAMQGAIDWAGLGMLCLGGFMLSGASNALNQVLEKDYDKLMKRTADRPVATGRMGVSEAVLVAGLASAVALIIFAIVFNPLTAFLGSLSLISYAFIYTPMKRVSPVAVWIGAFPGALPPAIGWVAVTGTFDLVALVLFAIQFVWQLPHFWAIGWVAYDDYMKGGYKLLPSKGGRDKSTALQCVFYSVLLIPITLLPYWMGMTGWISAIGVAIAGLAFAATNFNLYRKTDKKAALTVMFASFFYLPLILLLMVLDKL